MRSRDFDYVETRLLAPDTPLSEAYERLLAMGEERLANQLMRARQTLNEDCRAVRRALTEHRNEALRAAER